MHALPKETVRLISSSQVVTSIYSVVKELVENSLDAGANCIDVRLEAFGLDLIEVKDNGCGVSRKDVQCMAKLHHTSKICNHADLALLVTYGFRGEALGSLVSVSELTVTTRPCGADMGHVYKFNDKGDVISEVPSHFPQGTSVAVSRLFKCLPVRKQLYASQKRRRDELKRVQSLLMAYGVVCPQMRLSLKHDRSLIWQKGPASDCQSALSIIVGVVVSRHLKRFFKDVEGVAGACVEALLPLPGHREHCLRSTSDQLYVFVNKRPVNMKEVEKLVKDYIVPQSEAASYTRCPVGMVHLTVPPHLVDVNVEPNKMTVFLQAKDVIIQCLRELLENTYGKIASETPIAELSAEESSISYLSCGTGTSHHSSDGESERIHASDEDEIECSRPRRAADTTADTRPAAWRLVAGPRNSVERNTAAVKHTGHTQQLSAGERVPVDGAQQRDPEDGVAKVSSRVQPCVALRQAEESARDIVGERQALELSESGSAAAPLSTAVDSEDSGDSFDFVLRSLADSDCSRENGCISSPLMLVRGNELDLSNGCSADLDKSAGSGCSEQVVAAPASAARSTTHEQVCLASNGEPQQQMPQPGSSTRIEGGDSGKGAVVSEHWSLGHVLGDSVPPPVRLLQPVLTGWAKQGSAGQHASSSHASGGREACDDDLGAETRQSAKKKRKASLDVSATTIKDMFEKKIKRAPRPSGMSLKSGTRPHTKSVCVDFSLQSVKELYNNSRDSQLLSANAKDISVRLVEFASNDLEGYFCLVDGARISAFNPYRMKERDTFARLARSHKLPSRSLQRPLNVTTGLLAGSPALLQTLTRLRTEYREPGLYADVVEDGLVLNGLCLRKDVSTGEVELLAVPCSSAPSSDGSAELLEALQALASLHQNPATSTWRPAKVIHYLQAEAVRMVRAMPALTMDDADDLLRNAVQPDENIRLVIDSDGEEAAVNESAACCIHGRPALIELCFLPGHSRSQLEQPS